MTKRKLSVKWILLLLVVLALLFGVGRQVTLAYLTSQTGEIKNTFSLGNVTTEIEEDFEPTDVATVFAKTPVVVNTGKNDCYIRVRVTCSPENALEIGGWDLENWTKGSDGYYYYNKVVKASDTETKDKTTPLFQTVTIRKEYADSIEDFEVTVSQEAVQAEMIAEDGSSTTDAAKIWAAYEAGGVPKSFQ